MSIGIITTKNIAIQARQFPIASGCTEYALSKVWKLRQKSCWVDSVKSLAYTNELFREMRQKKSKISINSIYRLFFLMMALISVISLAVFLAEEKPIAEDNESVAHTRKVITTATDFKKLLVDTETGQRGFLLTDSVIYLEPYYAVRQGAKEQFKQLKLLTHNNENQQERLETIQALMNKKLEELQTTIDLATSGGKARALALVKTDKGQQYMAEIRIILEDFNEEEYRLLDERQQQFQATTFKAQLWYISAFAIVLAALVLGFFAINTKVIIPLTNLAKIALHLGQGKTVEFPTHLDIKEIERLLRAFKYMAAEIESRSEELLEKQQQLADYSQTLERKVDERTKELKTAQTRLRLAVKAGAVGIWEWDIVNNELTWDERMCELYGIQMQDFNGKYEDWADRVHPDDLKQAQAAAEHMLEHHSEYNTEFRVIHPDGQINHLQAKGLVQYDDADKPTKVVGLNLDISDRKKIEADMLKSLERERELSEMKSRFISNTSHEFRTPLAVIYNNAELLKLFSEKLDETQKQEYLDVIMTYVEHTTDLINEVLMVNKAEAGKISLNLLPLNVVEFSKKLSKEIAISLPHHEYQFVLEDKRSEQLQSETFALLDNKLLRQILTNLLSNVGKYSPVDSQISLELTLYDELIKFSITDQGIGIPEVDQKHLFKPFHRASNVGSAPGTGLGLSIVKHLITIHQGNIAVSSEIDEGSCFTVNIPTQWQEKIS